MSVHACVWERERERLHKQSCDKLHKVDISFSVPFENQYANVMMRYYQSHHDNKPSELEGEALQEDA